MANIDLAKAGITLVADDLSRELIKYLNKELNRNDYKQLHSYDISDDVVWTTTGGLADRVTEDKELILLFKAAQILNK